MTVLVNLHKDGSSFYLAVAKSQYLMAIGMDSGLSIICVIVTGLHVLGKFAYIYIYII